jgi:hypothetical protein
MVSKNSGLDEPGRCSRRLGMYIRLILMLQSYQRRSQRETVTYVFVFGWNKADKEPDGRFLTTISVSEYFALDIAAAFPN